ncbi:nucleoside triphosphate pyrophosphohydrolase [Bacillus aquiflavi]|uniref:Nucleoside triphosphate pyrophosphohydrolase n=1 Tax=Bacillus aquiflavi TaxID=2672567 RepID=A0A6B3VZV9_9BACI|nr:nucleoside triphosphate pyrophosphohydrolase [Bacillus aquiflavi]MBA4538423.1 nucleoside triphosphate pyrophosphohydrolase [Bacillus aquiflavi]NEY82788.1 nucleoside triphosphate pyrophosphohydrolase [Bacillus aquiflavi]
MYGKIEIIGLGAGDIGQLSLGVYRKLKSGKNVFLRTKEHPVVSKLEEEGILFNSFDDIYEKYDRFDLVYEDICAKLLESALNKSIIYAVPGHPLVAERTVQLLLERGKHQGLDIKIIGGHSFLDALFEAVKIDPSEGFQLLDGTILNSEQLQLTNHMIIAQVYDSFIASNVKLALMEKLPDDYDIYIIRAAGSKNEVIKKVPLYELDREITLNNLISVYVPPVKNESILYKQFSQLRQIIADLQGPNGCPWDKKQTHRTLKKYLIEEAYELIRAIEADDIENMIEELGDVLLQVMLHGQIGEDNGYFNIDDVIEGLSKKMVRRHPHVFGNVKIQNEEDVLENWEQIKRAEKSSLSPASLLDDVNKTAPNLLRAAELQKKAAKVGFDWDHPKQAWEKVKEEITEFEDEMENPNHNENLQKEFGDILFALVNVARFYKINAEEALFLTNEKFYNRFLYIEEQVKKSNKAFSDFTLQQLDVLWEEAKKKGL